MKILKNLVAVFFLLSAHDGFSGIIEDYILECIEKKLKEPRYFSLNEKNEKEIDALTLINLYVSNVKCILDFFQKNKNLNEVPKDDALTFCTSKKAINEKQEEFQRLLKQNPGEIFARIVDNASLKNFFTNSKVQSTNFYDYLTGLSKDLPIVQQNDNGILGDIRSYCELAQQFLSFKNDFYCLNISPEQIDMLYDISCQEGSITSLIQKHYNNNFATFIGSLVLSNEQQQLSSCYLSELPRQQETHQIKQQQQQLSSCYLSELPQGQEEETKSNEQQPKTDTFFALLNCINSCIKRNIAIPQGVINSFYNCIKNKYPTASSNEQGKKPTIFPNDQVQEELKKLIEKTFESFQNNLPFTDLPELQNLLQRYSEIHKDNIHKDNDKDKNQWEILE